MNSCLNELLHLLDISSIVLVAQHEFTWRDNIGKRRQLIIFSDLQR